MASLPLFEKSTSASKAIFLRAVSQNTQHAFVVIGKQATLSQNGTLTLNKGEGEIFG